MIGNEILPKELTGPNLRRGKWTVEEERYTEKVIMDFENGTLDVPEGTTLRNYLSKALHCDPMRITKKYTGNSSIGKRTFTPLVRSPENVAFIDMSQRDLEELRKNWISKLLLAEQWNNRKMIMMKNSCGSAVNVNVGIGGMPVGLMGVPNNYDHHPMLSKLHPGSDHEAVANLAAFGLNIEQFPYLGQLASETSSSTAANHHMHVGSSVDATSIASKPSLLYHPNMMPSSLLPHDATLDTVPGTGSSSLMYHNGQLIKDETIYHALLPFISDPMEIQYMMNWLKASCQILQPPTPLSNEQHYSTAEEIQQLIKIGEVSVPALYKMMLSGCPPTNAASMAKTYPYATGNPYEAGGYGSFRNTGSNDSNSDQLEHLQKVIAAYFDYNNIPADVANRVYQPTGGSKEGTRLMTGTKSSGDDRVSNESNLTNNSTSAKTDSEITPNQTGTRKDSLTSQESFLQDLQQKQLQQQLLLQQQQGKHDKDRKRKLGEEAISNIAASSSSSGLQDSLGLGSGALNAFAYPPYMFPPTGPLPPSHQTTAPGFSIPTYRDYINTFYRQKGLYPAAPVGNPHDIYAATATTTTANNPTASHLYNGPYGLPQQHHQNTDQYAMNTKYAKDYYDHEMKLAELQQRTNNAIQAQHYFLGIPNNGNPNNKLQATHAQEPPENHNSIDMNQFNRLYQHNLSHRVGQQGKTGNTAVIGKSSTAAAGVQKSTTASVNKEVNTNTADTKAPVPKKVSNKKIKLTVVPQSNEDIKVIEGIVKLEPDAENVAKVPTPKKVKDNESNNKPDDVIQHASIANAAEALLGLFNH